MNRHDHTPNPTSAAQPHEAELDERELDGAPTPNMVVFGEPGHGKSSTVLAFQLMMMLDHGATFETDSIIDFDTDPAWRWPCGGLPSTRGGRA